MIPMEMARATELADFRQCRRRWLYDREARYPAKNIPTALVTGSICHRALEKYHGNARTLDDLLAGLKLGADEQIAELREQGFCDEAIMPAMDEMYPAAVDMLTAYADYDHEVTHPEWLVVATEKRHTVTISPNLPPLSGQIDLLVRLDGQLYIIDHKTRSRLPDTRAVHLDPQLSAYMYIVQQVYGETPGGAIMNVLVKKKPTVTVRAPKLGVSPWQGKFTRITTHRSEESLSAFATHTLAQLQEMVDVAGQSERAYPNPGFLCPTCQYVPICRDDFGGGQDNDGLMPWEEA